MRTIIIMEILANILLITQIIAIWTLLDGLIRIILHFKQKNTIKISLFEILIGQVLLFGLVITIVLIANNSTVINQLTNSINSISRLLMSFDTAVVGTLSIFASNKINEHLNF